MRCTDISGAGGFDAVGADTVGGAVYCKSLRYCLQPFGGIILFRRNDFAEKIIPMKNLWLCSVFGAVLHNVGQLTAASAVMGTGAVWIYLPILVLSACISGALTGLAAQLVLNRKEKRK